MPYCVIKTIRDCDLDNHIHFKKDQYYVTTKDILPIIGNNYEFVSNYNLASKFYNINYELTNKRVLFVRSFGLGDILFLSPIVKYIKDLYPQSTVDIATHPSGFDIVKYTYFDNFYSFPCEYELFDKYDYIFSVAGVVENSYNDNNIYEEYFRKCGAENIDESYFRPIIKIPNSNNNNKTYIGIHPFSNTRIRQLDLELVKFIIDNDNNNKFVIFGNKKEYEMYNGRFNNIKFRYKSIDDTIDYLLRCKLLIATDSFITHLGQSLSVPTIAIYGPCSANSRVKYYKNIMIIDNHPDCRCMSLTELCPKKFYPSPCNNFNPFLIMEKIRDYS